MAFQIEAEPQHVFAALAALIFLGFVGNLIFSRLRVNDTLLLIGVGVLLGPVLGLVPIEPMQRVSHIVGPLALILILFDGGLALRLRDLRTGLGGAVVLGVLGFVLTAAAVGGVVAVTLLQDLGTTADRFLTGLVLGSILGGTSALVVLPTLQNLRCDKRTATTLGLESALTDVLVVVASFTLVSLAAARAGTLGAAATDVDAQGVVSGLVTTFSMSLALGTAAGLVWLLAIPGVREKPFGYMLTLGVMFTLYVATEWLLDGVGSGGGPLAVLAFGIVLGNHGSMGRLGRRVHDDFGPGIRRFQGELSFLVRTFFFIYLGLLVDLSLFRNTYLWIVGTAVVAAMLVARYVAVVATVRRVRLRGDDLVLWLLLPRGLAAAVLAAVPASAPYAIPGSENFVAIAFLVVVLTNLISTVGAFALERTMGRAPAPDAAPPVTVKRRESGAGGAPSARSLAGGPTARQVGERVRKGPPPPSARP